MEEKKSTFCSNCGEKLVVGSKFCNSCGTPTNNMEQKKEEPTASESKPEYKEEPITERKTVYEGNIHKCPNCGEVLESFVVNCPACGHEIRGTKNSSSVREFAAKLEAIEKSRPSKKFGIKNVFEDQTTINETDQQKISLIRSFVIPNTKEDLLEFLVLASSNINLQRYNDFDQISESQKAVSDAWEAKFEQAYEKAKLSFGNTPEFQKIQSIYEKKSAEIGKSKKKRTYFWIGVAGIFVGIALVSAIILISVFSSDNRKIEAENARLDAIVEQVYAYIEDENYTLARAKAATLVFSGSTTLAGDQAAEKWDKTREELLGIIDAAENGEDVSGSLNNDTSEKEENEKNDTTENSTDDKPISGNGTATFSEDSIVKDLKVTEYHLDDDGFWYTILVIENPSDYNLSITVNVKFYNKDGKLIGAEDREADAVEKKTHTIMYFMPDEEYDRIEYEFSVSEEDFYDCVVASLSYESVSAQDKEIISVTNNGKIPGEFVEAYALFFKDGKIVGFDSTYITDEDNLIKPGKTITEELDCYTEYDTVKFYFTGHGEW